MKPSLIIPFFLIVQTVTCLQTAFGPTEQKWGYVEVRKGAHMFWWLHQTSANVTNYTDRPLVICLAGGPGGSSTGQENFWAIGPLNTNLNPRSSTWIQYVNVLFVDNPVGTGFSYVDSNNLLTTTNREIANDFLVFLRKFYATLPQFEKVPLYIIGHSYGGKMAVEIALVAHQAIKNGSLRANLVGIGLADAWISPIDYVMTWGPFLLNLGIVDQNEFEIIQTYATATQKAVNKSKFLEAEDLMSQTQNVIKYLTHYVNFYNVFSTNPSNSKNVNNKVVLNNVMNNLVKSALALNHSWVFSSTPVFNSLKKDKMKPLTDIVETLLNTTDIKVTVYNGQYDLIVDTPGTVKWIDQIKFKDSTAWKGAVRQPLIINNIVEGYFKKFGNLAMYWVNRAGHTIPQYNWNAMYYILYDLTDRFAAKNVN